MEAIVALPLNMFYNAGIAIYVWVLTNRKAKQRRGKVQLIDATGCFRPRRKNMGKIRAALYTELGDAVFDNHASVRPQLEKLLDEWGKTASERDEDEDMAARAFSVGLKTKRCGSRKLSSPSCFGRTCEQSTSTS